MTAPVRSRGCAHATAGKDHPRLLIGVYLPFIVVAALCAALFMNNIAGVRNDRGAMRDAARFQSDLHSRKGAGDH